MFSSESSTFAHSSVTSVKVIIQGLPSCRQSLEVVHMARDSQRMHVPGHFPYKDTHVQPWGSTPM